MTLLWSGIGLFVVGVALIIVGRQLDARAQADTRSVDIEIVKPFFEWFMGVLKKQWPILTGSKGTTGMRLAAAGAILAAVAVVLMVAGIVVAIGSAAADAVTG